MASNASVVAPIEALYDIQKEAVAWKSAVPESVIP